MTSLNSKVGFALAALLLILSARPLSAQLRETAALTLDAARTMAEAARATATGNGWNVAIAVVDAGGHLLYFERMDGTQIGSVEIAIEKAKTSLMFKRPTKAFEDGLAAGRLALLGIGVLPFEGGLPVEVNGDVIGAIGVSGVTPEQDGIIARAGAEAVVK